MNMSQAPLIQQHASLNSSLINSQAASNYPSIDPQRTLINPQLTLNTPSSPASAMLRIRSRPPTDRRLRSTSSVSASSHKSNSSSMDDQSSNHRPMLHRFSLRMTLLHIIAFIWRLLGMIARLLKKEEKLLDTIEDDINEAADVVKTGSKVVEELAEGTEKVANAIDNKDLENVAKVVEEDAKRVDLIMDMVKERTKVVHDEVEEVTRSLGESMQDMEKVAAKVQIKPQEASTEEGTKVVAIPPSQNIASHLTKVVHDEVEEVASTLGESMQDVERVDAKVQVKPQEASMEEGIKAVGIPPSQATIASHLTKVVHDEVEEVASPMMRESVQDVEKVTEKVQIKSQEASMVEGTKVVAIPP